MPPFLDLLNHLTIKRRNVIGLAAGDQWRPSFTDGDTLLGHLEDLPAEGAGQGVSQ